MKITIENASRYLANGQGYYVFWFTDTLNHRYFLTLEDAEKYKQGLLKNRRT